MQRSLDAYRLVLTMFFDALPDLQGTIEDVVGEGDKVASRLRWRGTHQGELMGIPPSGKQVNFTMLAIHRIAESKIGGGWVNYDALA
jgi:predicted ester cyclase